MASIQTRLKALEGASRSTAGEGPDEQRDKMARYERMACLIAAHHQHHRLGVPIGGVLPAMLRYVDENEARRLLAMDYSSAYRAIGMPHHAAAKAVPEAKTEERVLPKTQVPRGWRGGR